MSKIELHCELEWYIDGFDDCQFGWFRAACALHGLGVVPYSCELHGIDKTRHLLPYLTILVPFLCWSPICCLFLAFMYLYAVCIVPILCNRQIKISIPYNAHIKLAHGL